jgi:hypothetical protein
MDDLRIEIDYLLEDERLPKSTRQQLENYYNQIERGEDVSAKETIQLAKDEIAATEVLTEGFIDDQYQIRLIDVSVDMLLLSPLPESTKYELISIKDRLKTGEILSEEEIIRINSVIEQAQDEIEASEALVMLSEEQADDYLLKLINA